MALRNSTINPLRDGLTCRAAIFSPGARALFAVGSLGKYQIICRFRSRGRRIERHYLQRRNVRQQLAHV